MKNKHKFVTISLILLLFWLKPAYTHDIWLFPEQSRLSKGDTLVVHQYVGSDLNNEREIELMRRTTSRFDLITAGGTINLLEELPDFREKPVTKPVLKRKLDFEGLALITMKHAFIYNEWTKEEFLHYLEHEEYNASQLGVSSEVFRDRIKASQTERYARYI
ncbi:MAG: hypothetical protein GWN62_31110 [Aliifodinibius sp.]|nr:hypothetical protein [Fodinibius sp.]NIW78560.1 hypothetical protein [Calditrichia bacterium]